MSATSTLLELQQAATSILKDLGQKATLTRTADGSTKSAYAVLMPSATNKGDDTDDFISGTDQRCYLEGKVGTPPSDGDTLTFSDTVFTITKVRSLSIGTSTSLVPAYELAVAA